jgi:hypothetical protein
MGNYVGLGNCAKCGKAKIDVHGEIRCIFCEAEKNVPSGLVVKIDDPGEAKMAQVLAASGIAIPKAPKLGVTRNDVMPQNLQNNFSLEARVEQALGILKSLPMPKDLKQFKAINKAIQSVEKIVGE